MVESNGMILYFPYGTDAPIYHRPIITVAMIVINYIVYVMFAASPFGSIDHESAMPYMLAIGSGLNPLQWLTCNFLHADFLHLLFNMFFLWVFGLVIEGKLGTLKMLAVYLGIGILFGATFQIATLGQEPAYGLGASAVISGLALMSLIWTPRNRIGGVLIVCFFPFLRIKNLETKISIIVGIFLVLEAMLFYFLRDGSQLGHLIGAGIGLIAALVLLQTKFVDCEHWDIISIWTGKNILSDEERTQIEQNKPEAIKRRKEQRQKRDNLLTEEIELALTNQTPLPAFIITQRKEREFTEWKLPQELHLKMIQQLLAGKHQTEAVLSMQQYLQRHKKQSTFVGVMLAQTYLAQNKPKTAAKILENVPLEELKAEHQAAIQKIRAKAEAMHQKNLEEGIYETEA